METTEQTKAQRIEALEEELRTLAGGQTKAQRIEALSHVLNILSSITYDIEHGNAIDDLDGEDIKRCIAILTGEIGGTQTEGGQS